jgi:hypothetical protein
MGDDHLAQKFTLYNGIGVIEPPPAGEIIPGITVRTFFLPYICQNVAITSFTKHQWLSLARIVADEDKTDIFKVGQITEHPINTYITSIWEESIFGLNTPIDQLPTTPKTNKHQKQQLLHAFYWYIVTRDEKYKKVIDYYQKWGWDMRIIDTGKGRKRKYRQIRSDTALLNRLQVDKFYHPFCNHSPPTDPSFWL